MIAALLVATSCQEKPAESTPTTKTDTKADDFTVVDLDGLKKLIEQHKGKVVFVDFWATWCVPCVKGLPDLPKMQEQYGPRGFQAIPVSFDDPTLKGTGGKMRATLERAGWKEKPIVVRDKAAQQAIHDWLGQKWPADLAIPAQYVFDRNGQPVLELIGGPPDKMAKLEKALEEQLGPPKKP